MSCARWYIHGESYMCARVLLNVLNEFGKRDKMRGLPSILSLFRNKFRAVYRIFATCLINSNIQEHEC